MSTQRIAVVTGASRGLGLALVAEFSAYGWQVIGIGRSPRPRDLPVEVTYRQFDASNFTECELFWRQLRNEHPAAEFCLINNAGGYVSGGLAKTTPEDFAQQMNSCYFSAVYMTRGLVLAVPQARIINIISSSALAAHKNNSAYGAAKAAEKHFFESLQQEFTEQQYQITNLHPSNIASDGPRQNSIDPKDLASFVREQAENNGSHYLREATIYPR